MQSHIAERVKLATVIALALLAIFTSLQVACTGGSEDAASDDDDLYGSGYYGYRR